MPFLIAIGETSDSLANAGSLTLARFLGVKLIKISSEKEPHEVLKQLNERDVIVQLLGDAAKLHSSGSSWLEVIGAWRQPVTLMIAPSISGDIPGAASAYVSLCNSLSVPLVGLVQLGGELDLNKRRLDCLPWCGCIPSELLSKAFSWENANVDQNLMIEEIVLNIKHRKRNLDL